MSVETQLIHYYTLLYTFIQASVDELLPRFSVAILVQNQSKSPLNDFKFYIQPPYTISNMSK